VKLHNKAECIQQTELNNSSHWALETGRDISLGTGHFR